MLKTLFKEYCDKDIELNNKVNSQKTVNTECIGTFPLCSVTGKCIVHLYDSPGYGDYINNQTAIDSVRSFLITAHEKWLSIDGNKQSDQVCFIYLPFVFNTLAFVNRERQETIVTNEFIVFSIS
jgi:hypothetical protein